MQKSCIFCAIVQEKIPAYRVYEDTFFLGFLDVHPRVLGHTLLIPKKHYRFVYDVPQFDVYWKAALNITNAMKKTLNPQFVSYLTHGLEIPHAHIHILPRTDEKEFVPNPITVNKEKMKHIAQLLHKQHRHP